MRTKSTDSNLGERLLAFVGHCMPLVKHRLNYSNLVEILEDVYRYRYSVPTLRKELSLLRADGLVTSASYYRRKIPALTRAGELKISPRLPYRAFGGWDDRWRVIIFDVPETDRKYYLALQERMRELGWKPIRSGVYISPHPTQSSIKRMATDFGISQHLTIMEVERLEHEKQSIASIWRLDDINNQYENFIKRAHRERKRAYWPLRAKELERQFALIYGTDPHLPDSLLPTDWLGTKAYEVYKEITKSY